MSFDARSNDYGTLPDLAHEQQFHDDWAMAIDPASVLVDESWQACTCPEHRWIRSRVGDLRGKRVLDVGCGAGEAAVWFAKQGADVTALDISPEFLQLVERVAQLHGVHVQVAHADASGLPFGDGEFDLVYAGNVLHHVAVPEALDSFVRVLKEGGLLASWDPLAHNPLINVYRRLAREVRTADEHPLAVSDLRLFRSRFAEVEHRFFWLTTLLIFLRFYLIERVHPGKERYWKKIVCEHERLAPMYRRLERLDRGVLSAFPFLGRYCWNVAVVARKGVRTGDAASGRRAGRVK